MRTTTILFVIGEARAACRAAGCGWAVRVCDRRGISEWAACVIRDAIPRKLLVYASHFSDDFELARSFGWTCRFRLLSIGRHSLPTRTRRSRGSKGFYTKNVKAAGVEIFADCAVFEDPHHACASSMPDKVL